MEKTTDTTPTEVPAAGQDAAEQKIQPSQSAPEPTAPAATPAAESAPADEGEMVKVKAVDLAELLENYKKLEGEVGILRESVSQGRLQEAQNRARPKDKPRIFLKKFRGQVVVGWEASKSNKIVYNPTTNLPIGEVQQAVYNFLDGSNSGIVDQVEFTRSNEQAFARVIDNQPDHFVIEFEDKELNGGKPYTVHKAFVNP